MQLINFIKAHKIESFSLLVILIVALGLRLYRIDEYMTFLGDEGRDVRIVRDIFKTGNLPAIGPQTSVGNMYLGPLYYYMMAPALLVAGYSPVGPAVMIAILGVFTIWLTWFVAREWFGKEAALISAMFFALSPVAIIYSRSSWNPNPMPFFALISVYAIYRVWQKHQLRWLPILGFTYAGALQMHYLGLLLAPTLFIFWLFTLLKIKKDKILYKSFWTNTFIAIVIFLVTMSPLALFDLKHQGMNFNSFKTFFSDRQTTINLNPARSDRFIPILSMSVSDLVLARTTQFQIAGLVITLLLSIVVFIKTKNKQLISILYVWLVFGFIGLGVYKQHVYIHYLGFLYPAFYLLMGLLLGFLLKQKIVYKVISVALMIYLAILNISENPLKFAPNRQLQRTEAAVDSIISKSEGKPFNFALLAKQNYDESYRYFFENKKSLITPGDKQVTDQLFVVCEDGDSCKPEGSSQYQVAIFGMAKVIEQWNIDYLKLYKMTHYK